MGLADKLASMGIKNAPSQGVENYISTGYPPLDFALSGSYQNGGMPQGRIVEMFGPPSAGKCIVADTYLLGEDGLLTVEELFESHGHKTFCVQKEVPAAANLVNEFGSLEETSHFTFNGRRKTKLITTRSGRKLEASHNHPIRVMAESGYLVWRKSADMKVGDRVPVLIGSQVFGKGTLSEEEGRLIGYLIADGTLGNRNRIGFSNSDKEVIDDYYYLIDKYVGGKIVSLSKTGTGTVDHTINNTMLREMVREKYGLDIVKSAEKTIPLCVRTSGRDGVMGFLRGYFELECSVAKGQIEVVSASNDLLEQVQYLLGNLGIYSTLKPKFVVGYDHTYWRLIITGSDYNCFQRVGFRTSPRIASYSAGLKDDSRKVSGNIPHQNSILRALKDGCVRTTRATDDLVDHVLTRGDLTLDRLEKIVDHFRVLNDPTVEPLIEHLERLARRDFIYDEVISIDDREAPTFDVCLPSTHSFWSNSLVSHNTAISTNVMVGAQKAGGLAIFMDHETSFDIGLAIGFGLDTDENKWVYQTPDTFEQSVETVKAILLSARGMEIKAGRIVKTTEPSISMDKPIVAVFDSLAAMVPQSTLKAADERNMNDQTALARATSAHFPMLSKLCQVTNTTMIFLNQVRTKLGVMYGDPTTTPGGGAPEYYASVRIKLGRSMITEGEGSKARKVGQSIGAETVKNKVSAPFQKAKWDFLFQEDGTGKFDVIGGSIDALVELGKIERGGAWTTWDGKKWNSRKALIAHIEEKGQYPELLALFPK